MADVTDYDPILHRMEAESAAKSEAVRQMIIEAGRPDVLAQYDEAMRLNRLGITGARATWHSISAAQRRVLTFMGESKRRLVRSAGTRHFYDAHGEPHAVGRVTGILTVRNLCSRELLAWDGGAFEPERAAVLTERGRFVLAHGPMPNGERFTG